MVQPFWQGVIKGKHRLIVGIYPIEVKTYLCTKTAQKYCSMAQMLHIALVCAVIKAFLFNYL